MTENTKRVCFLLLSILLIALGVVMLANRWSRAASEYEGIAARRCQMALAAAHTGADTIRIVEHFYNCPPQ